MREGDMKPPYMMQVFCMVILFFFFNKHDFDGFCTSFFTILYPFAHILL